MRLAILLLLLAVSEAALPLWSTLCYPDPQNITATAFTQSAIVAGFVVTYSIPQCVFFASNNCPNANLPQITAWNCSSGACIGQHITCPYSGGPQSCISPSPSSSIASTSPTVPNGMLPSAPLYSGQRFIDPFPFAARNITIASAASWVSFGYINDSIGFHADYSPANNVFNYRGAFTMICPSGYTTAAYTRFFMLDANNNRRSGSSQPLHPVAGSARYLNWPANGRFSGVGFTAPVMFGPEVLQDGYGNGANAVFQADRSHEPCGATGWAEIATVPGAATISSDDTTFAAVYSVLCTNDTSVTAPRSFYVSVFQLPLNASEWVAFTTVDTNGCAVTATKLGRDIPLWVWRSASGTSSSTVTGNEVTPYPSRELLALTSNGSCLAIGMPRDASGLYVNGSVSIYCLNATLAQWNLTQSRFTASGSVGFGSVVRFFIGDTRLAVSAPGSSKVYVFGFNPSTGRLTSTTPLDVYTGPANSRFGASMQFLDSEAVISAPNTTTCSGSASVSGTVYYYAGPVDCRVSDWAYSTACNTTCGYGTRSGTRTVTATALRGGADCPVLSSTAISCYDDSQCPVPCVLGDDWIVVSNCNATCGGGYVQRNRSILVPALYGGSCVGQIDFVPCNTQDCPPQDCVVSDWTYTSACNVSCGGGIANGTRTVVTPAAYGGAACPALSSTEAPCNTQPCFQNCSVSNFSDWGACSVSCGGGTQTRNRSVLLAPYGGGTPCPDLNETQACNTNPCPVDCVVSIAKCIAHVILAFTGTFGVLLASAPLAHFYWHRDSMLLAVTYTGPRLSLEMHVCNRDPCRGG
jgi:hypothetical protein